MSPSPVAGLCANPAQHLEYAGVLHRQVVSDERLLMEDAVSKVLNCRAGSPDVAERFRCSQTRERCIQLIAPKRAIEGLRAEDCDPESEGQGCHQLWGGREGAVLSIMALLCLGEVRQKIWA